LSTSFLLDLSLDSTALYNLSMAKEAVGFDAVWDATDPSEYGIDYLSLPTQQKKCWDRQEAYLSAYSRCRLSSVASHSAGITPYAVTRWNKEDVLSFKARLASADKAFCDALEAFAIAKVQRQSDNVSPLLLITLLNANLASKYRAAATMTDQQAREAMDELRKAIRRSGSKPKAEEQEIIDVA